MKRNLEIKIRFTRSELDALNKKARKTGMSREGYCRAALNGAVVRERGRFLEPLRTGVRRAERQGTEADRRQHRPDPEDCEFPWITGCTDTPESVGE